MPPVDPAVIATKNEGEVPDWVQNLPKDTVNLFKKWKKAGEERDQAAIRTEGEPFESYHKKLQAAMESSEKSRADFMNALDQASSKARKDISAVKTPENSPEMPFYTKTHLEKNQAPEKIKQEDLQALARAQALAVAKGVLRPEDARYFLANSLVENRPGNYGLSFPLYNPEGKPYDPYARFTKPMGITPVDLVAQPSAVFRETALGKKALQEHVKKTEEAKRRGAPPPSWQWSPAYEEPVPGKFAYNPRGSTPKSPQGREYQYTQEDRDYNARLAAAVLASKPGLTPQERYSAWNGSGEGAENHWRKVSAMQEALFSLPQNKPVLDFFNDQVKQAAKTGGAPR
jgi:hypothetical protein